MLRRLRLLAFASLFACVTSAGCAAPALDNADETNDAINLSPENLEWAADVPGKFPVGEPEPHAKGDRERDVTEWDLKAVKTRDGFEGLVAFGRTRGAHIRYLMAMDARNKTLTILDSVEAARSFEAEAADGKGEKAEADFVSASFDAETSDWLRREVLAIAARLAEGLTEGGRPGDIAAKATPFMKGECLVRLVVGTATMMVPALRFGKLGGAAAMFLLPAAADKALGDDKSAAAGVVGAVAGEGAAATARLFKKAPRAVVGAAGIVGGVAAMLAGVVVVGVDEVRALPGDRVEETEEATIRHHADGTRTVIYKKGIKSFLPAACQQAPSASEADANIADVIAP